MQAHSEQFEDAIDPNNTPVIFVVDDPDSPAYGTEHRMTQAQLDHVNDVVAGTLGRGLR